jgi:hypothetical protein
MDGLTYTPRMPTAQRGDDRKINDKVRNKIHQARERQDDGALTPDSRLLTSAVWDPLPGTTPVSLEHRKGCAWPVTRDSPHLFCNEPTARGSYCQHHHNLYKVRSSL